MPKQFKLMGEKFGDLVVKECIGVNNNKSKLWLCECVCGNMVRTTSGRLISGKKTNCGCKSVSKKNLVGQKFGKLTVMRKVGYIENNVGPSLMASIFLIYEYLIKKENQNFIYRLLRKWKK